MKLKPQELSHLPHVQNCVNCVFIETYEEFDATEIIWLTKTIMEFGKKLKINKQHGRQAPAKFLPNYKRFDQLLQTVNNEPTVLNLGLKVFYK